MIPFCLELNAEAFDDAIAARCRALADEAVRAAIIEGGLVYPEDAELSLLLSDDPGLKDLNNQWRGKDKPTNVLSFPGSDVVCGEAAGPFIGDIAISLDRVRVEAELENKSWNDHFTHLVIHGFLHLFGYDHETDEEAEIMEALEIRILKKIGIKNPYATVCERG